MEVDDNGVTNHSPLAATFKLSRDYISNDSSEGFEDFSIKQPYDSLVRQNIFELLEDLDRYRAPASFHNGESNESNTLNLTRGILTIPQTSDTTGRQTKEISPVGLEEHLFERMDPSL